MNTTRLGLLAAGLLAASLSPAFPSDCNENGVDDTIEVLDGSAADCNQNGIPDACDLLPLVFGFVPRDAGYSVEADAMAFANLDADDLVDLVTWTPTVVAHRNNGAGGFERVWSQGFGNSFVGGVALVDADRDADLDLVVFLAFIPSDLQVFLNNGDATFAPAGTIPIGEEVRSVEADDLDGDGHGDLAVVTETRLVTFTNDAGGAGFTMRASVALVPEPWDLTIANFDGDQHLDVAAVQSLPGRPGFVDVLFGVGGARFGRVETYATGSGSRGVAAADMNGDGLTDLISTDTGSYLDNGNIDEAGFSILSNTGEGVFGPPRSFILRRPVAEPVPADLDGDGDLDLIVSREFPVAQDVVVFFSRGGGEFVPSSLPFSAAQELPLPLRLAAPRDIDGDGDLDLAGVDIDRRLQIIENRPIIHSTDCNTNGVPDECEPRADPRDCLDCNENGVPDTRDLASGRSRDANRNGVPDECEGEPAWVVDFDAPLRAAGALGTVVSIPVTTQIHSLGLNPGEPGLQGWAVMVGVEGAEVADVTTEGTVARPAPEGLMMNGFEITGWVSNRNCDMKAGSAVALSFTEPVTLEVTGSPHDIFRMTLETETPAAGASLVAIRVITATCGGSITRHHRVTAGEDGDGGGATGLGTALTYNGMTVKPSARSKRITVIAVIGFHRGDVNDDGRLDISDPIRLLEKLFLGGRELPCRDAADSNDDGRLDVSDAIRLFSFLFLGGAAPPRPGPPGSPCGADLNGPDGDQGCEAYESC